MGNKCIRKCEWSNNLDCLKVYLVLCLCFVVGYVITFPRLPYPSVFFVYNLILEKMWCGCMKSFNIVKKIRDSCQRTNS